MGRITVLEEPDWKPVFTCKRCGSNCVTRMVLSDQRGCAQDMGCIAGQVCSNCRNIVVIEDVKFIEHTRSDGIAKPFSIGPNI